MEDDIKVLLYEYRAAFKNTFSKKILRFFLFVRTWYFFIFEFRIRKS